jgi:hypothetical protein
VGLLKCPAQCRESIIFCILKKSRSKSVRFFLKLYPRVLGLVATLDSKIIFIILIITLNLG